MSSYKFFQNAACEYFPCHKIRDEKQFNCLFCYCPLYLLGKNCGGNLSYTKNGIKNCSDCTIPHIRDNYDLVIAKLKEAVWQKKDNQSSGEKGI